MLLFITCNFISREFSENLSVLCVLGCFFKLVVFVCFTVGQNSRFVLNKLKMCRNIGTSVFLGLCFWRFGAFLGGSGASGPPPGARGIDFGLTVQWDRLPKVGAKPYLDTEIQRVWVPLGGDAWRRTDDRSDISFMASEWLAGDVLTFG